MDKETPHKNKEAYNRVTGKMFTNSLINIPLFAVPAFLALFIGKHFDKKYDTDKTITLVLLLVALATSWFFVLRNSRKLSREYKEMRAEMKAQEKQQADKSV